MTLLLHLISDSMPTILSMSFIRTHGCADTEDVKSESVYVAILTPAAATFTTILLLVILIFDKLDS